MTLGLYDRKEMFSKPKKYKATFRDEVKDKLSISFHKIVFTRHTRPATQYKSSCHVWRQLVIAQTTSKIILEKRKEKRKNKEERYYSNVTV